ncbi:MAG: hypothetical protein H0V82_12560 [Candidatus Protochlamydia sp.]|nr:hypothetical protein [Candidatus Protochlamydia sp.]
MKNNFEGNINQYDPQSYLFNRESFHASRKGKKTPNSGYYIKKMEIFMLQIITKIPVFVWPLFAILLLSGLRARKTNEVPLAVLLLIPSIFFGWSLFSFFGKYATNPLAIFFWFLCLGVGFFIGFSHMQKLKLQFDKQKKKVEMPGSWIPLMLSMSIFTAKFAIGMMGSMLPHLNESFLFLGLELFSTIILGIFAGRGVNCLVRYRTSSMENAV